MAQKIVLTCDVDGDGTEAEDTVKFGLDGREYEIDVCARHHRELNDALRSFVAKGRKVDAVRPRKRNARTAAATGAPIPTSSASSPASGSSIQPEGARVRARRPTAASRKQSTQSVREWAREHGMTVSDRGRISAEISEAYAAAHR